MGKIYFSNLPVIIIIFQVKYNPYLSCYFQSRFGNPIIEVILMAENLSQLLTISSSTRRYFISLPVWLQLMLHKDYSQIRTAAQLHLTADILLKQIQNKK